MKGEGGRPRTELQPSCSIEEEESATALSSDSLSVCRWTTFESAVSTEVLASVIYSKSLHAYLSTLPPKLVEIDGVAGPRVVENLVEDSSNGEQGVGPRIARVRDSLKAAAFTGKGDKEVVVGLYNSYIAKISIAINASASASGERVDGVYLGERNAAGEREGHGTFRFADGNVYQGQWRADREEGHGTIRGANGDVYEGGWKAGKYDGRGTYTFANGNAMVSVFKQAAAVGAGVKWSADGQQAWRLRDGKVVDAISPVEARRTSEQLGLPIPGSALPSAPHPSIKPRVRVFHADV